MDPTSARLERSVVGAAMSTVLAIVPARGGSKAVPRKNIQPVGGRPLIAWTIEAARAARGVERVIVSTDDAEIAEASKGCGADVPFLRPASLAADDTPGTSPILHAVEWLDEHEQYRPTSVIVLQPTSPLRTVDDIDGALAVLERRRCRSVVGVSPTPHHPLWMKCLTDDERLIDFIPEDSSSAVREHLPAVYIVNGAIYLVRRDVLMETRALYGDDTWAYVMPPERSLDIDTDWDLHVADLILTARLKTSGR